MSQRHKKMTAAAVEEEEGNVRQWQEIKQSGPGPDLSNNFDDGVLGGSTVDLWAGSTIDLGASVASTSDLQETSWDRGLLDVPATTGKRWGGVDESLKTNCGGADGNNLQRSRQGQRVGSAEKRARARKSEKEEGKSDEGEGVGGQGVEDLALIGSAGAAGDTGSASIGIAESSPLLRQSVEGTEGGGKRVGEKGGSSGGNGSDGHGDGGGGGGGGIDGEHRAQARRQKNSNQGSSSAKVTSSLDSGSQKKHILDRATLREENKVGAPS